MGLVAMQVSLLKLNTGIGRAIETTGTIERQNADLRASVSRLSSEERIQRAAHRLGLVMPPAGEVRYLTSRPREDAARAARVMRPFDPARQQAATALAQQQQAAELAQQQAQQPTAPATDPATGAPVQQPSGTDPATGAAQQPPATPTAPPAQAPTAPAPTAATPTPPAAGQ
jgi:predicted component of type VI protein secretion system